MYVSYSMMLGVLHMRPVNVQQVGLGISVKMNWMDVPQLHAFPVHV